MSKSTRNCSAWSHPRIWRAFPPSSKRRNIATSFAHIHNVRCMRIKMSHSSVAVPLRRVMFTIHMLET